jgi:hypothetical protein
MKWHDIQPGFCESVVSGPPEYVNSISSLAMVFFGLMGLFVTQNHNIIIRVTSAFLTVTGIGSIAFHASLQSGWGHVDALPMLLASYIGAYQAFDVLLYKKLLSLANTTYESYGSKDKRLYERISGLLALIFMSLLSFTLAISLSEDYAYLFSILFAIPEILIGLAALLIRFVSHNDIKEMERNGLDAKDIYHAFNIMYIGFGLSVAAAIFWFTTELYCKDNTWLRFLYAHGIWHITISLGMYFLMQFLVFTYSFNVGKEPFFVRGERWYSKAFYCVVPTVNLKKSAPFGLKEFRSALSLIEEGSNSL